LSKSLKEAIDRRRGDVPRSKYISTILERQLVHENKRRTSRKIQAELERIKLPYFEFNRNDLIIDGDIR
jgi:hypothetical protein